MALRFVASEAALDYLASTRSYLERHGKPVAFYSDKARIFRVAAPEAGNAYRPESLAAYNARFACEPRSPHDAHRPMRDDENLALIFTWQDERQLSKNRTFPDSLDKTCRRSPAIFATLLAAT